MKRLLLALFFGGCAQPLGQYDLVYSETRAVCAERSEEKIALFGDLHVHTALSFDAWTEHVRKGPEDAYAFAQGASITLPPLDENGEGTRQLQLPAPLDFAAVTDHAEFFGEVQTCLDPAATGYETADCATYRQGTNLSTMTLGMILAEVVPAHPAFCDAACLARSTSVWDRIQAATEAAYDRSSACRFTSFHGYEYTAATGVSNLHRNVIFRNGTTPSPITYLDEPEPEGLWRALKTQCNEGIEGCEALVIPHNSNLSNGKMFRVEHPEGLSTTARAQANQLRQDMERSMEIFQHKGDMECMTGLGSILGAVDEQCGFEKALPQDSEDCGDGTGQFGMTGGGCTSVRDYLRGALIEGMQEAERSGVNPFKLGVIASTDTHNASPGHVSEKAWKGHTGRVEWSPEARLGGDESLTTSAWRSTGGGLVGVWAYENSRDAIFEALHRRESWGTSGPRISLRFFGGWDLPTDLCDDPDLVKTAYAQGVPMGMDLPAPGWLDGKPRFVVSALRAPDLEGEDPAPLERIQLVKLWIDGDGQAHQSVIDLAESGGDYRTDAETCEAQGRGADSLCGTFEDLDFEPSQRAVYYARILEHPRCRWSQQDCRRLAADARPEACHDPEVPKLIQERAWSSPIWWSSP
ncbi:MAG: hypothetical protein CMH55_09700 [Myxococcales bacterium]|nr:hypothetical protein [Myxococcales bacterium]